MFIEYPESDDLREVWVLRLDASKDLEDFYKYKLATFAIIRCVDSLEIDMLNLPATLLCAFPSDVAYGDVLNRAMSIGKELVAVTKVGVAAFQIEIQLV
jgi:hypothetical protein